MWARAKLSWRWPRCCLRSKRAFKPRLMAPTQILAEQHYAVLRRWLEPLGVPVSLRTSARTEDPLPLFALGSVRASRVRRRASSPSSRTCLDPALPGRRRPATPSVNLPHFEKSMGHVCGHVRRPKKAHLVPDSPRALVLMPLLHFHGSALRIVSGVCDARPCPRCWTPGPEKMPKKATCVSFRLERFSAHRSKRFSARRINQLERNDGELCGSAEWFDRCIRSETDLQEKFDYITRNPLGLGVARPNEEYSWALVRRNLARQPRSSRWTRRPHAETGADQPVLLRASVAQIFVGTHALLYEPEGLEKSRPGRDR